MARLASIVSQIAFALLLVLCAVYASLSIAEDILCLRAKAHVEDVLYLNAVDGYDDGRFLQ